MTTKSEKKVNEELEAILGPPPDFSANLEIAEVDDIEHAQRSRATMPGVIYPDTELDKRARRKNSDKTRRKRNARSSA